ncbi:ferredoxin [Actinomadura sp. KC216]|uniref:ferredoxin n=1 Tax=Actinomadura sp. KC216 TaxID=2530370 RepID=UPI0010509191|nr:ferredoxin [Actinomadura sp. KC216]TDB91937.1 ferredoxin [Actinomadura sp. KC216]
MRVIADYDRCEGHGLCEEQAPDLFRLDDEGRLHPVYEGRDIPADLAAKATAATGVCPVAALRTQR